MVDTILYIDQVPAYALKEFFALDIPQAKRYLGSHRQKNTR